MIGPSDPTREGGLQGVAAAVPVEPMRWWDIDEVVVLERELFPTDSPWTPGMFWAELAAGHHYVVHRGSSAVGKTGRSDGPASVRQPDQSAGAPGGQIVVGYAGLAIGPDTADVQTIGVAPGAQRRGVGRALLRDLLSAAGDLPVMLEVRTDNAPAIALYESEGFQRVGVRRRYYQPSGADAFTMRRPPRGEAGQRRREEQSEPVRGGAR